MSPEMHTFLVERYFQIIHKTYPVFDWPSDFLRSTLPTDGSNGFLCYIRAMVYSIACHCLPRNDPRFIILSGELYRQAIAYAEDIMSRVSVAALQAVLLLALRCLFDPHEGSLGQQIAFAKSLMTELASRGLFENSPLELPLRRTLYCLDNFISLVLDRPSGPPEMVSLVLYDAFPVDSSSPRICHILQTWRMKPLSWRHSIRRNGDIATIALWQGQTH